jgi:hypothetical protein
MLKKESVKKPLARPRRERFIILPVYIQDAFVQLFQDFI